MLRFVVVLGLLASSVTQLEGSGKTVFCVLKHSAVAGLDERGRVDVHTTDNDEIAVSIQGIGQKEAVFNGQYRLVLLKEDQHAYYYAQPSAEGMVLWVYYKAADTITYAKLRAFPGDGTPSSYLMIAKCL